MHVLALLYHDVTPAGEESSSGFSSPDASIYKFSLPSFEQHMAAIAASQYYRVAWPGSSDLLPSAPCLFFTFDDGGCSALTHIAPLLERYGWRGYFFIATDWINKDGFLCEDQIRQLAARGHLIGSHSCSHPLLMARLSDSQLEREWRESVDRLSSLLKTPVTIASVPGGHYSAAVAHAAARAGVRLLFNSEPTTTPHYVGDCLVVGRFSLQRGVPLEILSRIAAGDQGPIRRQRLYWTAKKLLKKLGGNLWLSLRRQIIARRENNPPAS